MQSGHVESGYFSQSNNPAGAFGTTPAVITNHPHAACTSKHRDLHCGNLLPYAHPISAPSHVNVFSMLPHEALSMDVGILGISLDRMDKREESESANTCWTEGHTTRLSEVARRQPSAGHPIEVLCKRTFHEHTPQTSPHRGRDGVKKKLCCEFIIRAHARAPQKRSSAYNTAEGTLLGQSRFTHKA